MTRSGSTLLGDLLALHPASSYFYEPVARLGSNLCTITDRWQRDAGPDLVITPTAWHTITYQPLTDRVEEWVGGLLNCSQVQISQLNKKVSLEGNKGKIEERSTQSAKYAIVLFNNKNLQEPRKAARQCDQTRVSVAKTVRLRLDCTLYLRTSHPRLKVRMRCNAQTFHCLTN